MFVSIITVSYNAERLLGDFLDSIMNLNYPKNKFEIIVVDNGSTDGSVKLIKENYPRVKVLEAGENLGFGRGNNFGMKRAKGDLFLLVNNDTVLEVDSLTNLIKTYKKWSKKAKIGAINSKLVLIDKYLPLKMEKASFAGYKADKTVKPINIHPYVMQYHRISQFTEEVLIPINHRLNSDVDVSVTFATLGSKHFNYGLETSQDHEETFASNRKTKRVAIHLTNKDLKNSAVNLIQNAGNTFFRDGFTRDRGACIAWHKQYYEVDVGQYDREEFIHGFCGAGVLLNKKALDDVGYFDEDFFFYYEDGDLSLRLKKGGWEILFAPKSIIRHIHAASSKEWSPFFVFNSEKNRLLMVSKHWPRGIVLREWIKYIIKDTFGKTTYHIVNGDGKKGFKLLKVRLKVNLHLIPQMIKSMFVTNRLSKEDLKKFF